MHQNWPNYYMVLKFNHIHSESVATVLRSKKGHLSLCSMTNHKCTGTTRIIWSTLQQTNSSQVLPSKNWQFCNDNLTVTDTAAHTYKPPHFLHVTREKSGITEMCSALLWPCLHIRRACSCFIKKKRKPSNSCFHLFNHAITSHICNELNAECF